MDVIASQQVNGCILLLFLLFLLIRLQVGRLLSALVHLDNLLGALCSDRLQISGNALVGRVGDESSQDIGFEIEIVGVECLQYDFAVGQFFACFHVVIYFVV